MLAHTGEYVEVTAVAEASVQTRTHNLTVANFSSYFVIADGLSTLVHNQDLPTIHTVADDWSTKGAHVHTYVGGERIEISLRGGADRMPDGSIRRYVTYEPSHPGLLNSARGRRLVGTAIQRVRAAMQNPRWHARLLRQVRHGVRLLGESPNAGWRAGSGKVRALQVALEDLCP